MRLTRILILASATINLQASGFEKPTTSTEARVVTGMCRVNLGPYIQKHETCEILTPEESVPQGSRLVIEHVSAACTTTADRPIHTLALITKQASGIRAIPTHIPVALQASTIGRSRYVGASRTRIYSGEQTNVEILASTWELVPAGDTSCQVTFHGVLEPVAEGSRGGQP